MILINKTLTKDTPCKQACPVGIDIPRYIRLIREEKFAEALAMIYEKTPFSGVLAHVCPHFCEEKCQRGQVDEPVAINALKRFLSENDIGMYKREHKIFSFTGKRVAVIGSGPAGLTAAYYLTKIGHKVVVFEALPVVGGMMRVGIPEYRLPRNVLDKEIKDVRSIGFEIKTSSKIWSLDDLSDQGYDAILLAIGAHIGREIPIPGANLKDVLIGVTFLRDVNLGRKIEIGEKGVVLGGGDVAFDCARTALRLGARDVHIVCLEARDQMLANPSQIIQGTEEGLTIHPSCIFNRILSKDGELIGVECLNIKSFRFDENGKAIIDFIEGSEHVLAADTIITAIGQVPALESLKGDREVKITKIGTLDVNMTTLATGKRGVFAAGDAVTGTASVVEAIAAGRRSAISIDKYLGGDGNIEEVSEVSKETSTWLGFEESILDKKRNPMPLLGKEKRLASFSEVELGFTKGMAIQEACRCLRCDQQVLVSIHPDKCTKCYRCQMICSLIYQRAFNPEKARIVINLPEISWTGECIGGCTLCIERCLNKAIVLE
jgi:formate dehydrogenase beta subunit